MSDGSRTENRPGWLRQKVGGGSWGLDTVGSHYGGRLRRHQQCDLERQIGFASLRHAAICAFALFAWTAIATLGVPAPHAMAQTSCTNTPVTSTETIQIQLSPDLASGACMLSTTAAGNASEELLMQWRERSGQEVVEFYGIIDDGVTLPNGLQVNGVPANNRSGDLYIFDITASGTYEAIGEATLGGTTYLVTAQFTITDSDRTVTSVVIEGGAFGGTVMSTDTTPPTGYTISTSRRDQETIDLIVDGGEAGATYAYTLTDIEGNTLSNSGKTLGGFEVFPGIDLSALSDGLIQISLTLTDPSGNTGLPATALFLKDTTGPSVTITADAQVQGPFTATFTFSEGVIGFELADITVGNGTASNLSNLMTVNGKPTLTATITPIERGIVTLDVAAAVAEDAAGNLNTAADQVTVSYFDEDYARQRTQRIISNFMSRRGDAIVSNQPVYTERLNQSGQGGSGAGASFSGEGSYSNNHMNFATSLRQMLSANKAKKDAQVSELTELMKLGLQSKGTQSLGLRSNLATNDGTAAGFDLWVRGRWARYENDTNEGDLGLLFIGADYKFDDGLVVGVVAQFDWTDESDSTEEFKINGRGWTVGPYLVAQLHQNLIFDANFSWGKSDNKVSPFNTYTDSFDGTRWLVSAKFTGSFKFGHLHIAPHIGVLYFQERQDAYIDSLSIDIPSQTVKLGRLTFGPKISTTIQRNDGTTISPYIGVKGLWDFERTDIVDLTTGLAAESTDDLRARIDAGVSVRLPDGLTLNGEGFYDGIGADNYKSYGGSIRLNIPLQQSGSPQGSPSEAKKLGAKPRASHNSSMDIAPSNPERPLSKH